MNVPALSQAPANPALGIDAQEAIGLARGRQVGGLGGGIGGGNWGADRQINVINRIITCTTGRKRKPARTGKMPVGLSSGPRGHGSYRDKDRGLKGLGTLVETLVSKNIPFETILGITILKSYCD